MAAVCVLIATSSVGSGGALALPAPGLTAIGFPVLGLTTIGLAPGWVTTGMPALVVGAGIGVATGIAPGHQPHLLGRTAAVR